MTLHVVTRALWLAFGSMLAAIAPEPAKSAPQDGWPPDLQRVDVFVEDDRGDRVSGLAAADFDVRVDGKPRAVERLRVAPDTLLAAAILVDVTASHHRCPSGAAGLPSSVPVSRFEPLGTRIPPAVAPFPLDGLRRGDRIRVGSIGQQLDLHGPYDGASRELRQSWTSLFERPPVDWLGPSPVWDAVDEAVSAVAAEPGPRVVVLVSDGLASGNRLSWRDVAARATLAGVSINVVGEEAVLPTLQLTPLAKVGIDPLAAARTAAAATGGHFVLDPMTSQSSNDGFGPAAACFQRDPRRHLRSLLGRLRGPYVLGIPTSGDAAGVHTLEIRVTRPGLVVRARRGYEIRPRPPS
jgi:hypothetical protein